MSGYKPRGLYPGPGESITVEIPGILERPYRRRHEWWATCQRCGNRWELRYTEAARRRGRATRLHAYSVPHRCPHCRSRRWMQKP